jgi:hypothetical protein
MPEEDEEEIVVVGFRKQDIRKIAEFCTKEKIPVINVDAEKTNWNEIIGKALESPVLMKVMDLVDHHLERKHQEDMDIIEEEMGIRDVDYEDVDEEDDEDEEE